MFVIPVATTVVADQGYEFEARVDNGALVYPV